jgi:iron(III) transport system permease protein
MTVLVAVTGIGIISMLAVVLWLSVYSGLPGDPTGTYTIQNYVQAFGDGYTYVVLFNTFCFSFVALIVALFFGIPCAWLVERTNLPGKALVLTLMTVGLLIPGFAEAMGWMFLLHPRIGMINLWLKDLLGLAEAPFNIGTLAGMGWVLGLNLAPVGFFMTAAVFRAMDPTLEEAAYMCGANLRATLRRITFAISRLGITAAAIYVFLIGFAAFDVPAILGWGNRLFTFSTYIVLMVSPESGLPRYGPASALSTSVVMLAVVLGVWYDAIQKRTRQFGVVSGRAYRPRIIYLNQWVYVSWGFVGLYFVISKLLPLLVLLWASVLPFFQLPSARAFATISGRHYEALPWTMVASAFAKTSVLMVLTPTIALVISLAFSWAYLRTNFRGRAVVDFIAFLPHSVPHIIFGIGALLLVLFVLDSLIPMYGTLWVLLIVFVIARVSYGTRIVNSSLAMIHRELEESARVGGANTDEILWRIIIPLLRPTFVYGWLWIALLTYRELSLAVVLTTRDNLTVPVLTWHLWAGGGLGPGAALAVVMLLTITPLIVLYWVITHGRRATSDIDYT